MGLQRSYLPVLGLFVSIPGYYGLAVLLYSLIRPDPDNPWGALIYTLSQLVGFIILLQIAKKEGGGFRSIYVGGLGFREIVLAVSCRLHSLATRKLRFGLFCFVAYLLNPVCVCSLFMDWRVVDERLIRRGELLLSLDFLESYDLDLSLLNCGKVGRPYKVTYMYVMFLAVVRYLFSMPYRQLEGFTRALHRLIPRLPPIDYSWVRRRILRLDLRPYMSLSGYDGPVSIAVDY
jgi:hypothetical protein